MKHFLFLVLISTALQPPTFGQIASEKPHSKEFLLGSKESIKLTDESLLKVIQLIKDQYTPVLATGDHTVHSGNSWTSRSFSFKKLLSAQKAASSGPIYYVDFELKENSCYETGCLAHCYFQIVTCKTTIWDRINKPLGGGRFRNSTDLVDISCTKDEKEHDEFEDDRDLKAQKKALLGRC
ncbi:hypothetical protein TYRP_014279 [Tyrophagus putrescentiae]|nr:hypothetical protein TYRP_014279 [Tyrophagus putrescentiae]